MVGTAGPPELIGRFEIHPELGTGAEGIAETLCGFWRDAPLPGDELVDHLQRTPENLREVGLRPPSSVDLVLDELTRRKHLRRSRLHVHAYSPPAVSSLVIILDAHDHDRFARLGAFELDHEPELIVQAHGALMAPCSLQFFKAQRLH